MESLLDTKDAALWNKVFCHYKTVLELKASKMSTPAKKKDLLKLDEWYQNELPKIIADREEKYITKTELCQLMKWKLTRGKFRPRLTELVAMNTEDEVVTASTKAFHAMPDLSAAIKCLIVLKAIGPATASAVLAAGCPDKAAFMADESMLAIPGLKPLEYTLKFYLTYAEHIKQLVKKLNQDKGAVKKWGAHDVEVTLWTYHLGKMLGVTMPVIGADQVKKSTAQSKQEPKTGTEPTQRKRKRVQ